MHRQVGILVSVAALFLAIITAPMLAQQAAPPAPRKPGSIDLVFTDKQQDLAQEFRAMSAEAPSLLAMRQQIDKRLDALVSERQEWIKKVEGLHPGFKLIANAQGEFYLEPVDAPAPATKK